MKSLGTLFGIAFIGTVWLASACVGRTCEDAAGGNATGQPELQRHEFSEQHMGVDFTLTFYAETEESATIAAKAAFARIEQLNKILSDYDPQSELSKLSAGSPHAQGVPVSDDLWTVMRAARQVSHASNGAFDVTVGPLTKLWRRSKRQVQLPPRERLAPALAAVGYRRVILDEKAKSVRLTLPDMRLDLGGIAKGYAADEALEVLAKHGITRALVDGSGDVALGDPPPGEPGWKVGIAPLAPDGPPSMQLILANRAIATSGDAWQHVVIDGTRYSHIVDPKTGLGLTHQAGVTVIAPNCMTADALASAVSVLGAEKGIVLAEKQAEVDAMFIALDADGMIQKTTTSNFVEKIRESHKAPGFTGGRRAG